MSKAIGEEELSDEALEEEEEEEETKVDKKTRNILNQRAILMLTGPISNGHLGICHELLSYHYNSEYNDAITLLINSPGGSCDVGWAIVDVMNFIRLPVHTVCIGLAASMAADIFVNGDHRVMGEHSTLMIHPHSSISAGSHSKLIASLKGDIIEHNRRVQHYVTNSKYNSIEAVEKHLVGTKGEDLYLSPDECLKHGLTDEIAISTKKAKRKQYVQVLTDKPRPANRSSAKGRSRKGS